MNKSIKILTIIGIALISFILFNTDKVEANSSALLCIDNIKDNKEVDNTLNIAGWVMSEDKNATIKAVIQGTNIVSSDFTRFEREDVLKSITNYGGRNTNPTPGYIGKINIANLPDGMYNLTIQVISSDNNTVLKEQTVTIKVRNV